MNTQVVSAPADQWIACRNCGEQFLWSAGEQAYYAARKITAPRCCRNCRAVRKAENETRDRRVEEALVNATKQTGVVEVYFADKGYGFLRGDGERLFFHCSALRCKPREIKPGVKVEFYIIPSVRRPGATCAERVTLAETENGANR